MNNRGRLEIATSAIAQALFDAQGWPSGKQRLANKSITFPLWPQQQIADSWILFNLGATPLYDDPIAAVPRPTAESSKHETASGAQWARADSKCAKSQNWWIWNFQFVSLVLGRKHPEKCYSVNNKIFHWFHQCRSGMGTVKKCRNSLKTCQSANFEKQ